mmetsp:Transcript_8687/g.13848  ORF Transcript_8687/g.13848 Transcript_8687/m.13848 type:complete len:148 (-) Transcript_8687:896-1339(-)|eukprot:CAMPEP_0178828480 /NCGR_PEP_ID=MMETSP0746-20121128/7854_1 /TAXON_ID=913974 /ORGANISM="Nitzschia punctata, Strain CCMP561" /LENGTH=147 /DNA_ID=CAMNT_0020490467 /DNA_START=68 /DNA_END=511 /DNA_ORIENTATION=-
MPSEQNRQFAVDIAVNWAKELTAAAKGGPLEPFKNMFADQCYVILQGADGGELEFTIGDDPDSCSMTWEQFAENSFKDLEAQNYDCTTTDCLGVLGNRMILEAGRLNKKGELYMTATSLVEFNEDGKIIGFEAFNAVDLPSTVTEAS